MSASELRLTARKSLKGNWGKAALLVLCYSVIMYVISLALALIPIVGPIANAVISVPISYGFVVSFIKLKRGEEFKYAGFLNEAFANFGRVWGVYGHTLLKLILPLLLVFIFLVLLGTSGIASISISLLNTSAREGSSVLFIISFVGYIVSLIYLMVKGLLYSFTNYILYDNPNMSGKEIVEESERLMKGNRWKLIWLGLTFIGWAILSVFTLYIGLLWLLPYISISTICFYESLSKNS